MIRDGAVLPRSRPRAHRRVPRAPGRPLRTGRGRDQRRDRQADPRPPPSWRSPTPATPGRPTVRATGRLCYAGGEPSRHRARAPLPGAAHRQRHSRADAVPIVVHGATRRARRDHAAAGARAHRVVAIRRGRSDGDAERCRPPRRDAGAARSRAAVGHADDLVRARARVWSHSDLDADGFREQVAGSQHARGDVVHGRPARRCRGRGPEARPGRDPGEQPEAARRRRGTRTCSAPTSGSRPRCVTARSQAAWSPATCTSSAAATRAHDDDYPAETINGYAAIRRAPRSTRRRTRSSPPASTEIRGRCRRRRLRATATSGYTRTDPSGYRRGPRRDRSAR